jgi:hypothetical protein
VHQFYSLKNLGDALLRNCTVEHLSLASTRRSLTDLAWILDAASHLPIRVLDVSGMSLTDQQLLHVVDFAMSCRTLERLECFENHFAEASASLLGTAMAKHSSLRYIDVSRCGLGDSGLKLLLNPSTAEMGRASTNRPHTIRVAHNCLTNNSLEVILQYLATNNKLRLLDTRGNFLHASIRDDIDKSTRANREALASRRASAVGYSLDTNESGNRPSSALRVLAHEVDPQNSGHFPSLGMLCAAVEEDA